MDMDEVIMSVSDEEAEWLLSADVDTQRALLMEVYLANHEVSQV
jgi:hypothetical protein